MCFVDREGEHTLSQKLGTLFILFCSLYHIFVFGLGSIGRDIFGKCSHSEKSKKANRLVKDTSS